VDRAPTGTAIGNVAIVVNALTDGMGTTMINIQHVLREIAHLSEEDEDAFLADLDGRREDIHELATEALTALEGGKLIGFKL
jgi:hypothetical protein